MNIAEPLTDSENNQLFVEGTVYYKYNGTKKGAICSKGFDEAAVDVLCKSAGYKYVAVVIVARKTAGGSARENNSYYQLFQPVFDFWV